MYKKISFDASTSCEFFGNEILGETEMIHNEVIKNYFNLSDADEKEIDTTQLLLEYLKAGWGMEKEINDAEKGPLIAKLLFKRLFNDNLVVPLDKDITLEDAADEVIEYPAPKCQLL